MKRLILPFILLFTGVNSDGQGVGIGTTTPDASAAVEVSSVTKGMLMPRMTTAQRDAIASPAAGLIILNLDDYCLDIFDGTYWSKNCGLRITGIDSIPEEWTQKTNFGGTGRHGAVSFVINNKAYVGTGYSGDYEKDLWEYNPATNGWIQKADLPGQARSDAVGFAVAGNGYVATGFRSGTLLNDVWKFTPGTNSWIQKSNIPGSARMMATAVVNPYITNNVYMVGGLTEGFPLSAEMWVYTADQDYWILSEPFPFQISGAVGFALDGKLVVGTGYTPDGYLNDFYSYDLAYIDEWQYHSTFGGPPRSFASAMVIGSDAYVCTGSNNSGTNFLNDVWKYNYTSGWTSALSFPGSPRDGAETFVINGTGYLATGNSSGVFNNDLWAYTPAQQLGYNYQSPLPPQDAHIINDGIWSRDSTGNIYSDNTSKVGIGISTPHASLQLSNDYENRKIVLHETGDDDQQYFGFGVNEGLLRYQTTGDHAFYYGANANSSNELMRITSEGRVGIGVSAPDATLEITRGTAPYGAIQINGTNYNSHFNYGIPEDTYIRGGKPGAKVIINDYADFGNVGIGTANPLQKLHVGGKMFVENNLGIGFSDPHGSLQFGNILQNRKIVLWESTNNDHQYFGFGINGSTLRYQVGGTSDAHVFFAGTSASTSQELMRIKGNGNVTITGLIENEGYAAPALLNGFTIYGNGYASPGYYKDKQGIVRLHGTVYKNSNPNGQGVFILPAGYRPSSGTVGFSVSNNGALGLVEILWDGAVFVQNCVAGWISLDGISFRAD